MNSPWKNSQEPEMWPRNTSPNQPCTSNLQDTQKITTQNFHHPFASLTYTTSSRHNSPPQHHQPSTTSWREESRNPLTSSTAAAAASSHCAPPLARVCVRYFPRTQTLSPPQLRSPLPQTSRLTFLGNRCVDPRLARCVGKFCTEEQNAFMGCGIRAVKGGWVEIAARGLKIGSDDACEAVAIASLKKQIRKNKSSELGCDSLAPWQRRPWICLLRYVGVIWHVFHVL